jgi:histidyl-tRNA synthetase
VLDPHLVRGLDYYRHTAFEFVTNRLGSQGAVIAGGRYDGLMESLGGPHTPAIGWAAGIERLSMMIEAPEKEMPEVAVVVEDDAARDSGIALTAALRRRGFSAELIATGSARKRYDKAVKLGCREIVQLRMNGGSVEVHKRVTGDGESRIEDVLSANDWSPVGR